MKKDFYKINGISTETLRNVFVDTPELPAPAAQRVTTYNTGADEDGTTKENTYENISYSLTLYTYDREIYDNTDIYAFFANARTLEISRMPGFYYKIQKVTPSAPQQDYDAVRVRYTYTLLLSPFRYSVINDEITLNSGDTIINDGTKDSKPTLEVRASNPVDITLNGKVLRLNFSSDITVIVETDGGYVYNKATLERLYNFTSGSFPTLKPGENRITWTGNATVEMRKNERWY